MGWKVTNSSAPIPYLENPDGKRLRGAWEAPCQEGRWKMKFKMNLFQLELTSGLSKLKQLPRISARGLTGKIQLKSQCPGGAWSCSWGSGIWERWDPVRVSPEWGEQQSRAMRCSLGGSSPDPSSHIYFGIRLLGFSLWLLPFFWTFMCQTLPGYSCRSCSWKQLTVLLLPQQ